jgi:hypothetical protein
MIGLSVTVGLLREAPLVTRRRHQASWGGAVSSRVPGGWGEKNLNFKAECQYQRLATAQRPGNAYGLAGACAVLALAASAAPAVRDYAADTLNAVRLLAESGFSPQTPGDVASLGETVVRVVLGTFLFSFGAIVLMHLVTDISRMTRRRLFPRGRAARRGLIDGVHFGPMEVHLADDAVALTSGLSRVTVQWPTVLTAALRGGDLVLTLQNGAAIRIAAGAAEGGGKAVLQRAREALAASAEAAP